jgi:DNA-binding GntR family transcriptional regulator
MERTTYDERDRAIEFGQHVYRASRYALLSNVTAEGFSLDRAL